MNAQQQQHPTPQQLSEFAQGKLTDQAFSQVEQHLLTCDRCCEAMASHPESTLLRLARDAATKGFRQESTDTRRGDQGLPAELVDHPRYQVLRRIGKGGMGSVYLAEHRMMQRNVALKVIHPWLLADQQHIQRFQREVRAAAKLSHPHIVTAYDADQAGDLNFLVMEHVAGVSLDETIAAGKQLSAELACEWARQTALGLQHAHEQGMVHRDIKPHNLMVTHDGGIKILDFGLTRLTSDTSIPQNRGDQPTAALAPTSQGMILGTPDYIAPEQINDSSQADIRADIYSLGCTLFHMLAGAPPFPQGSLLEKLHAHGSKPLPRLDQLRPEIPKQIVAIIDRMTAKDPNDRYATPGEAARALEPFSQRTGVAPPVAPPVDDLQLASALASRDTPPTIHVSSTLHEVKDPRRNIGKRRATKPPNVFQGPLRNIALFATIPIIGLLIAIFLPLIQSCRSGDTNSGAVTAQGDSSAAPSAAAAVVDTTGARPRRLLLLLPSEGLWYGDYQRLREAVAACESATGIPAELIVAGTTPSPSKLQETSAPGVATPDRLLADDLSASDFDALITIGYDNSEFAPGGAAGLQAVRLMREFQNSGKVIASLCAGQRLLLQHGVMKGRRVAECEYMRAGEVAAAGATPVSRPVVQDGQLITASSERDAAEFVEKIVKSIQP